MQLECAVGAILIIGTYPNEVFTPLSHQHVCCSNTTNVTIFFHRFSTIIFSGSKTTLLFPCWRLFVTLNLSSALSLPLSLVFCCCCCCCKRYLLLSNSSKFCSEVWWTKYCVLCLLEILLDTECYAMFRADCNQNSKDILL